jgi:Alpha-L-arabinofuranosidase B, catalytic
VRRSCRTKLLIRHCYRVLAIVTALLSVTGLALSAAPARAATSAPSLPLSRIVQQAASAAAAAAVTPPSGNVTLDVDPGISLDTSLLRQLVTQVQGQSSRLSDGYKRILEGYSDTSASIAQAPEFTTGTDWQDFDGTLAVDSDGTGVSVTIPAAEVQTSATFWQNVAAIAVGSGVLLIVRALCVGAFVAIGGPIGVAGKAICAAIGNFIGVFVRGWMLQAFDHTLGDPTQWGETIAEAVLSAVGPTLWEAGVNRWAENTLPTIFSSIYNWLANTFIPGVAWLGSTIIGGLQAFATFLGNVGASIGNAVRGLSEPASPSGASCDRYAFYGTPCAAAYSMDRALYTYYDGPLYQVKRASDGTTRDIGLLAAGGYVNAATQDSFCFNTGCVVTKIYDQSSDWNDLTIGGPGGPTCSSAPGYSCSGEADHGADAGLVKITVDGKSDIEAYGLDITGGVGYADDATNGVATDEQPEGTYMVASGTNVNGQCCMDFGNAETNRWDNGNGHMDAVRIGTGVGIPGTCWFTPCNGSGPWVGVDMENGTFLGANGSYLGNTPVPDNFVTAMTKNDGRSTYAIETGNAQSGALTTQWSGALPNLGGYTPMQKEGGIVLGTGGDNSNAGIGTWFEGVMTSGYPSSAADAAVQANIVAAGYAGNSAGPGGPPSPPSPPSPTGASAGTAGQAVLHDGYTSVYTVDASDGHLDETYLPAVCAPNCAPGQGWATQDLTKYAGTPPVQEGTQPVALYHDGYTSVYTVDAGSYDLQETYLAAICAPGCAPGQGWATQDLSLHPGTPQTAVTPSAVYHDGYVSVYTVDAVSGDLDETYLAGICAPGCAPGQGWATQDLSLHPGTPPVLGDTSPVAVLHDGYVSVYTVDGPAGQLGDLQETYLATLCAPGCAPGQGWATQDLTKYAGTPPTFTTPGADYHSGYTSVYTVDISDGHLDETYLAAICAPGCAPGQGWATQDLSLHPGTPPVRNGTSPVALFHDGFNSVYTVDASDNHLDETYLPAICAPNCAPGQGWATQDLSVHPGTPRTDQTPIALLHLDQSGNLNWVSVWTIDEFSRHLDETYLPAICAPNCAPGQGWATQDLSVVPGTPPAT